jgi:hypothetical protein
MLTSLERTELLKIERAALVLRNKELERIKNYRKYRAIVPEVLHEIAIIEKEERENSLRVDEINRTLGREPEVVDSSK